MTGSDVSETIALEYLRAVNDRAFAAAQAMHWRCDPGEFAYAQLSAVVEHNLAIGRCPVITQARHIKADSLVVFDAMASKSVPLFSVFPLSCLTRIAGSKQSLAAGSFRTIPYIP